MFKKKFGDFGLEPSQNATLHFEHLISTSTRYEMHFLDIIYTSIQ